jgi:hypothetical protein
MSPLVIRSEQLRIFQNADEDRFCRRAAAHIRAEFPLAVGDLSDGELLRRVDLAYERARRFHFTTQATVLGYMVLMFIVGAQFDTHPAIHEILHQEWIPSDARLAYLAEAISPEEWEEARTAGDGDFWARRTATATF